MELNNQQYSEEFLVNKIANESPTFKSYLIALIADTNSKHQTNEVWLGTLNSGEDGKSTDTQIKLSVTQDYSNFIDEN